MPNPIIIGGGIVGYGEAIYPGIDPTAVGAIVVGPIMRHSSGGSERPRVAEGSASFVLQTGFQNRGVSSTLKQYGPVWARLGCPIITQVADSQPEPLLGVVEKLNEAFYRGAPISGIELLLPQNVDEERTELLVASIARNTDLPLIVNLPLLVADFLADPAVYAGADALVIGFPPLGALFRPAYRDGVQNDTIVGSDRVMDRQSVVGAVRGPGLFPQMLETLIHINGLKLGCALIGAGGIHTVSQAQQVLQAGAVALQLGSAIWVEPGIVRQMVDNVST